MFQFLHQVWNSEEEKGVISLLLQLQTAFPLLGLSGSESPCGNASFPIFKRSAAQTALLPFPVCSAWPQSSQAFSQRNPSLPPARARCHSSFFIYSPTAILLKERFKPFSFSFMSQCHSSLSSLLDLITREWKFQIFISIEFCCVSAQWEILFSYIIKFPIIFRMLLMHSQLNLG